ncbi:hypothetical protein B0I37DRAFT_391512 [Chaetomium sp. MPI-CAGE-AT-0009]|nr:hypothetical protein B0I37DRAFT_391512 [Chaetomium sp. MPI-CAGE-AT-0009]
MYHNTNPQERGIRNPNHPTTTTTAAAPQSGVTYGQSPASGPAPTTAGHHKHDILNKLDPRVDSTHDRQPMPTNNTNTTKIPEGTYGPHRSRAANALDPRVDSDLDSMRASAAAGTGGGPAPQGSHVAEGTYGPHHSRVANAADPRVDSDRDRHRGFGATAAGGYGSGAGGGMMGGGQAAAPAAGQYQGGGAGVSAPHTAGPHKSGLLNKLDPRVDSKTGAYKDTAGTKGAY